jgi:hypothetical protein
VSDYRERAAETQVAAEKAFNRGDRLADQGKDAAAVRAWQEGRRLHAVAEHYRTLATTEEGSP